MSKERKDETITLAATDSSSLWGTGRVEDTHNLLGHALKKVMRVVANQRGASWPKWHKKRGQNWSVGPD